METQTDRPKHLIPPPVLFLGYLVSAIVLQWVVAFNLPWPIPLRTLGGLLVVVGLALAFLALREMRKLRAMPGTQQPAAVLVTTGPFGFSRNPIYLGFLLIYLGFTLLAGTLWGLLMSPFLISAVTRSVIHAEEAYLGNKFGDQYKLYCSLVRRWL